MKKLLGIMVLGLLWCNVGFAEIKLLEEKIIKGKKTNYLMSTFCIDGYKFVVFDRVAKESVSMVQFIRQNKVSGATYPVKC